MIFKQPHPPKSAPLMPGATSDARELVKLLDAAIKVSRHSESTILARLGFNSQIRIRLKQGRVAPNTMARLRDELNRVIKHDGLRNRYNTTRGKPNATR